jgi:hypothetical protein
MRRLIIHLVVWAFTFSIGITLKLILTANPHMPHTAKTEEIKLYSLNFGELSVQSGITFSTPTLVSDHGAGKFNPSGDYHPVNRMIGELDKSTYFDLRVRRRKGKLLVSGEVKNHAGTSYKFAYISITERHLKFTTVNIHGVEYKFDGRFLGKGDFASQTMDEGQIMLEGALQKFIDGEKVTEIISPFLYYPGC